MRRRVVFPGTLIVVVLALSSLFLINPRPQTNAKGTATVASSKIYKPPPEPPPPSKTYEIFAGFWRTDGQFDSTLRIRNELLVAPLDVTPVLFMADGTEYDLPSVRVATGGVAVVDINQALASAPDSIAPHLSQFGSAKLEWQYTSAGHVVASIQMLDVPESLVYVAPFNGLDNTKAGQHTLEGLWWRHDAGVGGYVSLANVTDNPIAATLEAVGSRGTVLPAGTYKLGGHTTRVLELGQIVGGLPGLENQAGGIRIQYNGPLNGLVATGGLTEASIGYSARVPFWFHDTNKAKASTSTYTSTGLMHGFPNPAMGFPEGVRFAPYLVLRNTSTSPLAISLTLNWMSASGGPMVRRLPKLTLAPLATEQYDMKSAVAQLGLANANGPLTVSVSFTGHPGDLVMATGSVDDSGSYVFEVEPQGVSQSLSKQVSYWTTANGFDSVFMLHNPTGMAEDLTVTFYYGDGSGSYVLPVHLVANGSKMIDVKVLVESQLPDPKGHVFPVTETEGSAVIRNTAAGTVKDSSGKKIPAPVTLVTAGGVYNVRTATCGTVCITCCGYSNPFVTPSVFYCPLGESMSCGFGAYDCNGNSVGLSGTWSTSTGTVCSVNSTGLMTPLSPGTCTISAQSGVVNVYSGQICSGYNPACPTGTLGGGTSGSVLSVSQSPASLNMSTGDTKSITVSVSPSSTTVTTSFAGTDSTTSNPDSSCGVTLSVPGATGSGSIASNVTASPAGCSGVFSVKASASGASSSNSTTVNVPPQVLIQMMHGEAGCCGSEAQLAVGVTARNRFGNTYFSGDTNYQNTVVPSQFNGIDTSITTGVAPELDNAISVWLGSTQDFVTPSGGSASGCFWTPSATEWSEISSAVQNGTTDESQVPNRTGCYSTAPYGQQIRVVAVVGGNSGGVPWFVFQGPRPSSSSAVAIQF